MALIVRRLNSTAISLAEYNDEDQTLSVTFRNGMTYDLSGVPPDLFDKFVSASSPGSFYNTYLRGQY